MGSRMSLNASSADEANDDDDFKDAMFIMDGKPAAATKRKHRESGTFIHSHTHTCTHPGQRDKAVICLSFGQFQNEGLLWFSPSKFDKLVLLN